VGDATGAMVDAVGVHNGAAEVEGPPAADTVAQRDVEQVNLILLLRVLLDALGLLHIADEVAERILPTVAEADGPFPWSGGPTEKAVDAACGFAGCDGAA